jgi:hypothetical protein
LDPAAAVLFVSDIEQRPSQSLFDTKKSSRPTRHPPLEAGARASSSNPCCDLNHNGRPLSHAGHK